MYGIKIFTASNLGNYPFDVDVLPSNEMTRLPTEQEREMIEHLVKPIRFRFVSHVQLFRQIHDVNENRFDADAAFPTFFFQTYTASPFLFELQNDKQRKETRQ